MEGWLLLLGGGGGIWLLCHFLQAEDEEEV
jgi:hypothetical protein